MIETDKKLYVSPLIIVMEVKLELGFAGSGTNSSDYQTQRLSVGMNDYFPHHLLDREEDNVGIANYNSVHLDW